MCNKSQGFYQSGQPTNERPTEWFSIRQKPPTVGWYEYSGFMIDEGTKLYWNGTQWGHWTDAQQRKNWTQLAEVATDRWRGLYAQPQGATA